MIGIYCIEHISSGKKYIGKSININKRLIAHKCLLTKDTRSKNENPYLYNAVQKYGWCSFRTYVLCELKEIDNRLLSDFEVEFMDLYDTLNPENGYNLRRDSSGGMTVHPSTRMLQSISQRGKRNGNYGNHWTDHQKLKASTIAKERHKSGKFYNDSWKKKISKASTELWKDEEKKKQMAKKVSASNKKYIFHQFTRENIFVKTWTSVKEIISENPNYKWQNIYSVCNGYKPTYMGFIWKKELKI